MESGEISIVFSVREKVLVRRGEIHRIGWMIKVLEAQVGQFLLCFKWPVSRGVVLQEQEKIGEIPAQVFFKNVLQLHQKKLVIISVDS